jgi:hypothetical protein
VVRWCDGSCGYRWRSTAALPTVLLLVPLVWYSGLIVVWVATGMPWGDLMQWLQAHTWVPPPPQGGHAEPFWKVLVPLPHNCVVV